MKKILVAGIGNVFYRDDAFGVAVVQELLQEPLPDGVNVVDFGIRGVDLAFALLDEQHLTILVDATQRGGTPGTLYTIEPDMDGLDVSRDTMLVLDSHRLDPAAVLRSAKNMGALFHRVLLVGCEPEITEDDGSGTIGLTEAVKAAVTPATKIVLSLVRSELEREADADKKELMV